MKLARLILNVCEKILKEQHEDSYVYDVSFTDNTRNFVNVAPGLRGDEATNTIEKFSSKQVKKMNLHGEWKNGVFRKAIGGELR